METVKATLGLGTRSVTDVKSEFFIFYPLITFVSDDDGWKIANKLWSGGDKMKKSAVYQECRYDLETRNEYENIPVNFSTRGICSDLSLLCLSTCVDKESYNNMCHI